MFKTLSTKNLHNLNNSSFILTFTFTYYYLIKNLQIWVATDFRRCAHLPTHPNDSCKFVEPTGGVKKKSGGGKQSIEQQLLGEAGSDIDDDDLEASFLDNRG